MRLTKSGLELKDVIEKAIEDNIITKAEYDEILKVAEKDGYIDDHESMLLKQLHDMIADGTIKKVK